MVVWSYKEVHGRQLSVVEKELTLDYDWTLFKSEFCHLLVVCSRTS